MKEIFFKSLPEIDLKGQVFTLTALNYFHVRFSLYHIGGGKVKILFSKFTQIQSSARILTKFFHNLNHYGFED